MGLRAVAVRTGGDTITAPHRAAPLCTRARRARRRMRLHAAREEDAGTQTDEEALTCVWVDGNNLAAMSVDRLEALYTQVGDSTHPHPCNWGHRRALTGGELTGCGEPHQRHTNCAGCHVRQSGGEPATASTPRNCRSRRDFTHETVLCGASRTRTLARAVAPQPGEGLVHQSSF